MIEGRRDGSLRVTVPVVCARAKAAGVDIGNVLTFCSSQASFRVLRHLYKVCIVSNNGVSTLLQLLAHSCLFQVFQLTALAIRGPVTSGEKFTVNLDQVATGEEVVHGVLLCVQDFVRDPVFTQRSFFSETVVAILSEAAGNSKSITSSFFYPVVRGGKAGPRPRSLQI